MTPNPNYQKMMKQVQKMQSDMARMQEDLASEVVEASAGGGMVTVQVTGSVELKSIKIDPAAIDPEDVEMLEDMIMGRHQRSSAVGAGNSPIRGWVASLPGSTSPACRSDLRLRPLPRGACLARPSRSSSTSSRNCRAWDPRPPRGLTFHLLKLAPEDAASSGARAHRGKRDRALLHPLLQPHRRGVVQRVPGHQT